MTLKEELKYITGIHCHTVHEDGSYRESLDPMFLTNLIKAIYDDLRKELTMLRDHYLETSKQYPVESWKSAFYLGKRETCIDLLERLGLDEKEE